MEPVQRRLVEAMAQLTWADPRVPLVANVSGEIVTRAADVRRVLLAQIAGPVRWVSCVGTLRRSGCGTFLELGPGRVLTGLARQIDREVDAAAADSPQKIDTFVQSRPALAAQSAPGSRASRVRGEGAL